jgi:hypothetical protein
MDHGQAALAAVAAVENGLEWAEVGVDHIKDPRARECVEALCEALRGFQYLLESVRRSVEPDAY